MTPLLLRYRPCFEPLVWTVNDETGGNEPDLGELAEKCEEQGCDPYCTPGPSQVRILSLHLFLRRVTDSELYRCVSSTLRGRASTSATPRR